MKISFKPRVAAKKPASLIICASAFKAEESTTYRVHRRRYLKSSITQQTGTAITNFFIVILLFILN